MADEITAAMADEITAMMAKAIIVTMTEYGLSSKITFAMKGDESCDDFQAIFTCDE